MCLVLSPKVVVLCIGTNNTGQRVDPALETAAGIKAIDDDLRARLPTAKIILMAIFPCQLRREPVLFGVRNDKVNAIIRLLADRDHVRFLDLGELYRDRGRNLDRKKFSDGLHLSAAGYECWAAALKPLLVRFLGDRRGVLGHAKSSKIGARLRSLFVLGFGDGRRRPLPEAIRALPGVWP